MSQQEDMASRDLSPAISGVVRGEAEPHRVQLRRTKGWKMPPNTVKVDRTTKWGNPWTSANTGMVDPVMRFACETVPFWDIRPLIGKNLACWCRPGASCHADVLLELAAELEAAATSRAHVEGPGRTT